MGIVDTDHFDLMATNIPFIPVNYDLMNIPRTFIPTVGNGGVYGTKCGVVYGADLR
jgi:hypothetical protein